MAFLLLEPFYIPTHVDKTPPLEPAVVELGLTLAKTVMTLRSRALGHTCGKYVKQTQFVLASWHICLFVSRLYFNYFDITQQH